MSGHWETQSDWETYSLGSFPGEGAVLSMAVCDSSVQLPPVLSLHVNGSVENEQDAQCLPGNEALILSSGDSGVVVSKASEIVRPNPFDKVSLSETPSTSSAPNSLQTSRINANGGCNIQFESRNNENVTAKVPLEDHSKMADRSYGEHSPAPKTGQFSEEFSINTDDQLPFVAYEHYSAEEPVRMRPHRRREFGTQLRMSQGGPVVHRDQDGPRNLRDYHSIFGSKSRAKKRYVPPKTVPQRVQSISERFYDESCDQQAPPPAEDLFVSVDDYPTRRAQIKQSKKLPGWAWYILAKSLGIRTFPGEKRIIAAILHVMTLVFGLSFLTAYTWQRIYDIVSVYTKSTVLTGTVEIIICLCWVALTIYANKCAARLFSSRKFMLSVRLHSKTIFKVSAVGLIGFLALVFMGLNSYHSFSSFTDDHCLNVNLTIVVCKILYPARVCFNVFGIVWNLLVAFVLLSVCRTHTVGVRRFIKELELDGKKYERFFKERMSGTSDRLLLDHFHECTDADVGSDWFIWDDQASPPLEQTAPHPTLRQRSRTSFSGRLSLQGTSIDEEQEEEGQENNATAKVNNDKSGTPPAQPACPVIEDTSDPDPSPPIMTNEDILICYWKISCRMRMTSLCLQRWLSSWILFVVLWCSNYVIYWTSHDAAIMGIAEFVIPLIMIPLLASAYAEVNTEGQRMIRSICPVEERLALLFYLGQQPLQMTVFNFPVTYQGIVGVIAAFSVAFASRIILDEVLG